MAFVNYASNKLLTFPTFRIQPSVCSRRRRGLGLTMSQSRIGHGFDLHRLEPGLPLILGGVELKHDKGCAGHSDGDAVYHCVVDAVLGALSLPDIGQLFPDTDPRFKDCASHVFMEAAYERMQEKGYKIGNVDVTIILEKPKLSPHKAAIRENIASLLHTNLENVNVKAKTHEKVDAIGENRAVSVHAVTMLLSEDEQGGQSTAEAFSATPLSEAESITDSLLGTIRQRVSTIQDVTLEHESSCPIQKLYDTVEGRKGADPSSSWTAKLFSKGLQKIAQKVGEEGVEVAIEGSGGNSSGVINESADLLYHLMVLWADLGVKPKDVWSELKRREGTSGIVEKASRTE
ncbi:2C-methyl-D-erythritol 2,4-cyclodiphosphate synthase [Gracilaria domingensis]|nr:2C-methyl-D-erythritol 2,4-cyclodiphosphate synthase [Gracilaria domingensis]